MTEKELKQYRKIKNEIADLDRRIDAQYDKDIPVVAGIVKGSSKHFPYLPTMAGVWVEEPGAADKRDKLISMWRGKAEELNNEAVKIEEFINGIEDSQLRLIFRHTYFDGMKQAEIADKIGYTQGRISQKITEYLKINTINK